MKKLITLSIVFGSAVFLGACEGDKSSSTPAPSAKGPAATEAVEPAAAPALTGAGICQVSGAVGAVVDCPIQLAALPGATAARALQLTLGYDAQRLAFEGIFDAAAQGGARRLTAAEPVVSRTGHTLLQSPEDAASWKGTGSLVIAHFSSPSTPITQATVAGGAVSGDAVVAVARFKVLSAVGADAPAVVEASKLVAADDAANDVPVAIERGVLVTGGAK